jgi:hypothetical protein
MLELLLLEIDRLTEMYENYEIGEEEYSIAIEDLEKELEELE